jgi:hypothetical protein
VNLDFIGTYNWYKRIESRGKSTLRLTGNSQSVTVVPPEQYKTRFRDAMEQYFLSVPGKYSVTNTISYLFILTNNINII